MRCSTAGIPTIKPHATPLQPALCIHSRGHPRAPPQARTKTPCWRTASPRPCCWTAAHQPTPGCRRRSSAGWTPCPAGLAPPLPAAARRRAPRLRGPRCWGGCCTCCSCCTRGGQHALLDPPCVTRSSALPRRLTALGRRRQRAAAAEGGVWRGMFGCTRRWRGACCCLWQGTWRRKGQGRPTLPVHQGSCRRRRRRSSSSSVRVVSHKSRHAGRVP
jgi:hypothetical protein